jgi:hypothetical protein
MVTVKSPSEVLTVNASPLRRVITPLFFILSLLPMANAGTTTEVSRPTRQAVMTIFLATIIHASFEHCVLIPPVITKMVASDGRLLRWIQVNAIPGGKRVELSTLLVNEQKLASRFPLAIVTR